MSNNLHNFEIISYIPIPTDKMNTNTTIEQGAIGYEASTSSVGNEFTANVGNTSIDAFDGNNSTFWHSQYTSPCTQKGYHNSIYRGGGSPQYTFKTLVSSKEVEGQMDSN
jgi:hypothetical protein